MDSEIKPIFEDDEQQGANPFSENQDRPPTPPRPPAQQQDEPMDTPLEHVMNQQQRLEPQSSFYHQPPPPWIPPPQWNMHPQVDPALKWDPFSTIGVTSWVVISIVFMIGFVIGKLR